MNTKTWSEVFKGKFTKRGEAVILPRLLLMVHDLQIKRQFNVLIMEMDNTTEDLDFNCRLESSDLELSLLMTNDYELRARIIFKNEETRLSAASKEFDISRFIELDVESFNKFWNR